MGRDVGPGPDEHTGVADKAPQAADARRALARPLQPIGVVRLADDPRGGQVLEEVLLDADGTDFRAREGVIPGAILLSSYGKYDVATELPAGKDTRLVFYCADSH